MQLTYQPALDPFHTVFRLLRLRPLIKNFGPLQKDHVRILDFYLLFPFRIRDIRLERKHQKYKKLSDTYGHLKPYGEQPEAPVLLERMKPMQLAALETLAFQKMIDPIALERDQIKATEKPLPSDVDSRTAELNVAQPDLIEFLGILASAYSLSGENGVKARTGLLEHRYDAV
jgi:hypothetical protein